MRATVMYGPGDVRVEECDEPQIVEATDAIIRVSAACVCGSDLWPYRGIGVEDAAWPVPMGHEYAGSVEEVGAEVETFTPGQFVVGSFWASDNTCDLCRAGYQSACLDRVPMGALGAQAELLRVPLADGTLVATPDLPPDDLIPSLLAASDVLGTGWFGAVAAGAGPGKTVAVVGDGAVGLLAVLAARQLGAARIIAMSRHEPRQRLAREYGATDVVEERGDEGVAAIKELTHGLGAHSVVEAAAVGLAPEPIPLFARQHKTVGWRDRGSGNRLATARLQKRILVVRRRGRRHGQSRSLETGRSSSILRAKEYLDRPPVVHRLVAFGGLLELGQGDRDRCAQCVLGR